MPLHITLLGLGRLGASLGLALRAQDDLHLTGFDTDPEAARAAQGRGLVHRSEWNLARAVEGADLVLLALPLSMQRDLLAAVAPSLRPDGILASLAPLLGPPLAWAAELLPKRNHFVAGHPILSPAQLLSDEVGLDAARADLFARGLWALAPAPGCAPEALRLVGDLAQATGAAPYFVEPAEHDGWMGGADSLPAILAWALMRAGAASPGWNEMRKVADRAFATATAALAETDPAALLLNREAVLHYLDAALAELGSLRERVAAGKGPALNETLAEMADARAMWLADRRRGDWEGLEKPKLEMPSAGESVSRLFLGGLLGRKREDKRE